MNMFKADENNLPSSHKPAVQYLLELPLTSLPRRAVFPSMSSCELNTKVGDELHVTLLF